MTEKMLGLAEFARRAGNPYATMWRYKQDGKLPEPSQMLGASALWSTTVADKWIAENGGTPIEEGEQDAGPVKTPAKGK